MLQTNIPPPSPLIPKFISLIHVLVLLLRYLGTWVKKIICILIKTKWACVFVAVTYFTHVKYTRLWMIDCAVCFFKLIFLQCYANEPPTEKLLTKHVIFCRCTSTVEIKMIFSLAPPKFSTKKCKAANCCFSLRVTGFTGTAAIIGCLAVFFLVLKSSLKDQPV